MPRPVRHLAPQMLVALTLTQSFGADNCQKLQSKPRADSLGDGCDIGLHSSCSHPLFLAVPVSHFPKYCLTGGSTVDFDCRTRKISLTYRERVRTHGRDQRGSRPRGAVIGWWARVPPVAIPDEHVPKDYKEPTLGVHEVRNQAAFLIEAHAGAPSKTSSWSHSIRGASGNPPTNTVKSDNTQ